MAEPIDTNDAARLEAFENMLAHVQAQQAEVSAKMEDLRASGKTKSATYKQLFATKLQLQQTMSLCRDFGLVEDETK